MVVSAPNMRFFLLVCRGSEHFLVALGGALRRVNAERSRENTTENDCRPSVFP